jgi:hypothetical protein
MLAFACYRNGIILVCSVWTSNLYVTLIYEDDNDWRISLDHDHTVAEAECEIFKTGFFSL